MNSIGIPVARRLRRHRLGQILRDLVEDDPAGLVEADRHGREIRYGLVDPEVIVACDVMRGVLQRRLARFARLASAS